MDLALSPFVHFAIIFYVVCHASAFIMLTFFVIEKIRPTIKETPLDTDANIARLIYLFCFETAAFVSIAVIVAVKVLCLPKPTKEWRHFKNIPCLRVVSYSILNAMGFTLGVSAAAASHFVWIWKNQFEASGQDSIARGCRDMSWMMFILWTMTAIYLAVELLSFVYCMVQFLDRRFQNETSVGPDVQLGDIEVPAYNYYAR